MVAVERGCTPYEYFSYDFVKGQAGCVPCPEGKRRRDLVIPGHSEAGGFCFPAMSPEELRETREGLDRIYPDGWKLLDPLDPRLDMSSEDPLGVAADREATSPTSSPPRP